LTSPTNQTCMLCHQPLCEHAIPREIHERLIAELRQTLWDCFREAGGDTDGDQGPEAITHGLISMTLGCVKDLRKCYSDQSTVIAEKNAEIERLKQDAADLEKRGDSCERLMREAEAAQSRAERALAQTKEAKPTAYLCPVGCGCTWRDNGDGSMSLFGHKSQSCQICEYMPLAKLLPLYAAPQPPAGKSHEKTLPPKWHDLLREIIQDWMTADGYLKPLWAGGLKDRIQGLLACRDGDEVPREIHERLVRDAKREALREAQQHAAWPKPKQVEWADYDQGYNDALRACGDALDRMASDHERGNS